MMMKDITDLKELERCSEEHSHANQLHVNTVIREYGGCNGSLGKQPLPDLKEVRERFAHRLASKPLKAQMKERILRGRKYLLLIDSSEAPKTHEQEDNMP